MEKEEALTEFIEIHLPDLANDDSYREDVSNTVVFKVFFLDKKIHGLFSKLYNSITNLFRF